MTGERHALLVGCGSFDDADIPPLPGAVRDVEALRAVLTERGGFAGVTKLVDPTLTEFRRAVAALYHGRRKDDFVLFYFAGHGKLDHVSDDFHFVARDTELVHLSATAVERDFLLARMGRSGARRQAVILDCCHAAAALPGARRVGPERVHDEASFAIEGYGTEFLAATDKLRLAHEDEGVGSFTDALIEGLEGAAGADDAETITLRDLDDYVRRRLAERIADPTKEMRPIYGCHTETTFALVTKQRRQLALPPDLVEALTHDVLYARLGAVDALLDRVANEPLYAPDAIALIERRLAQDGERDFQVRGRLERARLQLAVALPRASPPPPAAAPADPPPGEPPFGELLQALPRNAADVDRMLLAGLFLQRRAAERAFTTADANRLLLEHGIKLGNPSQSVKQNLVAKRAFAVQRGRYRVAQGGLSHLEQLTRRRLSDS